MLGLISRKLEASVSGRRKAPGSVGLSLLCSACPGRRGSLQALLAASGEKAPAWLPKHFLTLGHLPVTHLAGGKEVTSLVSGNTWGLHL